MQMAARRFYAYYIRGRKLALIEYDNVSGSGQTLNQPSLDDIGPSGGLQWKSPTAAITDGIEIEYAYSPRYRVYSNAAIEVNKFYINGWTVIDGYLTFFRTNLTAGNVDWTSAPESTVTSGSSGDTGGQTLDYIVVRGSSRWNGLHKVQTAGTQGTLKTYTKVSDTLPYWESKVVDFNTSEQFFDGGSGVHYADYFSAGDYVFIGGATEDAENQGIHKVASVTTSNTATSSFVTLDTSYGYSKSTSASGSSLSDEDSASSSFTAADGSDAGVTTNIYKAYRDFSYVLTDVDVLNDESDTIDLPEYLTKALVYYVKAKVAEDRMELEQKEYNMREFKRLLEKNESSKIWGARRIGTDETAIR